MSPPRLLRLLPLLYLTACAIDQPPVTTATSALRGLVRGGNQPVSGSTIQLYAAGTGGDGSASTPLLSPAVISDSLGNFSITGGYTCPSQNSLVYIVASGGNPGLTSATNKPAITLMAALGPCGNLSSSTYINIDELTTVAAVYPLAPFSAAAIWNGSYRTTTLLDSGHVTVDIPVSDLTSPGTASLAASNPGSASSAPITITIN